MADSASDAVGSPPTEPAPAPPTAAADAATTDAPGAASSSSSAAADAGADAAGAGTGVAQEAPSDVELMPDLPNPAADPEFLRIQDQVTAAARDVRSQRTIIKVRKKKKKEERKNSN